MSEPYKNIQEIIESILSQNSTDITRLIVEKLKETQKQGFEISHVLMQDIVSDILEDIKIRRLKFWCEVYNSVIAIPECSASQATEEADNALKKFDERFGK